MTQSERIDYLISYLLEEQGRHREILFPDDEDNRRKLLRSLMNVRMPKDVTEEFLEIQDEYLKLSSDVERIGDHLININDHNYEISH